MIPVLVSTREDMRWMRYYDDVDEIKPDDFENIHMTTVSIYPMNFDNLDKNLIKRNGRNFTKGEIRLNGNDESVEFDLPTLTIHSLSSGEIIDLNNIDTGTYYYWDGEWVFGMAIEKRIEDDLEDELFPEEN